MKKTELFQLIDDLHDGEIDDADFLRLEAELHVDVEARQAYYERTGLHTILGQASAGDAVIANSGGEVRSDFITNSRNALLPLLALAATLVASLVVLGTWSRGGGKQRVDLAQVEEKVASGFAVLTSQADAVWRGEYQPAEGELLPAGELHLVSGVVQIDSFSGVSIVVEGEAKFGIVSAMEMTFDSGKLRAEVPVAARGFTVRTGSGDVVDLGTEFALDIGPYSTEVHVLDGEVEWFSNRATGKKSLLGGQAVRMHDGSEIDKPAEPERFAGIEDMERLRQSGVELARDRWNVERDRIANDPRTVVYYPTDAKSGWHRRLENATGDTELDGTIVAAGRAGGRWENDQSAVDFRKTGSRVRLSIPGEYQAITMAMWVKVHELDRWFNSLFLTDSYEPGEPHWQIMDDGRVHFSIRPENGSGHQVVYSPPISDTIVGAFWSHLAVTYNSESGEVAHFLNGEEISRLTLEPEKVVSPIVFGGATIGNWSQPMRDEAKFAVRNLNGALDEFVLFSEALGAEEIQRIYQNGRL